MKMRKIILLAFCLLIAKFTFSQEWKWVNQFSQEPNPNKPNYEFSITSTQISSQGNIFVGGCFTSNIKYGNTTLIGNPDISTYKPDMFIFKLDSSGNVIWGKNFGSSSNEQLDNIVIDSEENIYVSGIIMDTLVDFGSNTTLSSAGVFDGIIMKINSSGETQWAINVISGESGTERIKGLVLSEDEQKLYFAGTAQSSTFTIGDKTFENTTNGGILCVGSLNTNNGEIIWSQRFASTNKTTKFNEISIDKEGMLYAVGSFFGTLTVNEIDYTSKGAGDLLLMKIDPNNGNAIWIATGGSTKDDLYWSVNAKDEFIYSIGYIQEISTIDSTTNTTPKIQSSTIGTAGTLKMFISKYNMEGRLLWKKALDGGGLGYNLNVNLQDNILVATGYFSGSMDFNLNSITSNGGTDAAYFVFDTEGNPISAKSIKGTGNYEDKGQAVFLDEDFNVIIGGLYNSTQVDFMNGDTAFKTLTNANAGYPEGFIAKCTNDYVTTFTNKKNITCYGQSDGELTVTPYFGHSPYKFSWKKDGVAIAATDSALTNLSAGVYEATVIDSQNDTIVNFYTLTQPSNIGISFVPTDVTCYGGSTGAIDVSVSGGNGGYSYIWTTNDGVVHNATQEDQTSLIKGTYSVLITDKEGCTQTGTQTINEGNKIKITGTVHNVTNANSDGAVDITVTNAIDTITYSWILEPSTDAGTAEDLSSLSVGGNYTITVTDANSCSADTTFVVLSENVLSGYLKSKTDVKCKGDATGAISIAYVGTTNTVSASWTKDGSSIAQTKLSLSGLAAGTYEATLTAEGQSPSVVTVTISEPANILTGTTESNDALCYGSKNGSIILTPAGGTAPYTYKWTSESLSSTQTSQNISRLKPGIYSAVIADNNGCKTGAIVDTVFQPDAIDFAVIDTMPSCYGYIDGKLQVANITGGNGNYTYLWSNTLTASTISTLKSGYYSLKVTDSNKCYTTKGTYLYQPRTLRAGVSGRNNPSCPISTDGSIILAPTGGTEGYTCLWLNTQNDTVGTTTTLENIGVGTYTAIVTDTNQCSATTTVELVTRNSSPEPILTCTDTISCAGSEITFTGSGTSVSKCEFIVNGEIAQKLSTQKQYATSTLSNNDVVSIRVRSNAGCEALSSEITVTRNSLPSIAINASADTICSGDTVTLTASGAAAYQWDNEVTNGVAFNPTSTQTYTVNGTDDNGCSSSAQRIVSVNSIPIPIIATADDTTICKGNTIAVALTAGIEADSYFWTLDGTNIQDSTRNALIATSTGSYSVKVIKNGCPGISKAIAIAVLDLPTLNIMASDTLICRSNPVVLTASGANNFAWSHNVQNGVEFRPNSTTRFTVVGTDENGCASKDSITITIADSIRAKITTADPTIWCQGSEISTTLLANEANGYQWFLGNAPIVGATAATYKATEAGIYKLTLPNVLCTSPDSINIQKVETAKVSIISNDTTRWCKGNERVVTLTANPTSAVLYQWIKNGVNISNANGLSHTTNEPGSYELYAAFGGDGCNDTSDVLEIIEYPLPPVNLKDTSICTNESITIDAGEGAAYVWSCNNNTVTFDDNTAQSQSINGQTLGEGSYIYYVTVTSEHNCVASDSLTITVKICNDISTNVGWQTKIYPNPTNGCFVLNIEGMESDKCYIQIFSSTGALVINRTVETKSASISETFNLENEARGVYHMVIQNNGKLQTAKIVLN